MNSAPKRRRSLRLPGYDYSRAGAYFVTLCTQQRQCLFGEVVDSDMRLSTAGGIVQAVWNEVPLHYPGVVCDGFIVMPNHLHGIVWLVARDKVTKGHTLGDVVRGFKARVTVAINSLRQVSGHPIWQRNYYERIIRDDDELNRIRLYVAHNPRRLRQRPA